MVFLKKQTNQPNAAFTNNFALLWIWGSTKLLARITIVEILQNIFKNIVLSKYLLIIFEKTLTTSFL